MGRLEKERRRLINEHIGRFRWVGISTHLLPDIHFSLFLTPPNQHSTTNNHNSSVSYPYILPTISLLSSLSTPLASTVSVRHARRGGLAADRVLSRRVHVYAARCAPAVYAPSCSVLYSHRRALRNPHMKKWRGDLPIFWIRNDASVRELGRAAKKFTGWKASDEISKEKSRCKASNRLGLGPVCLVIRSFEMQIQSSKHSTKMALC